jgi:hypothetical protein
VLAVRTKGNGESRDLLFLEHLERLAFIGRAVLVGGEALLHYCNSRTNDAYGGGVAKADSSSTLTPMCSGGAQHSV